MGLRCVSLLSGILWAGMSVGSNFSQAASGQPTVTSLPVSTSQAQTGFAAYYQPYFSTFAQKAKDGLEADKTNTFSHSWGIKKAFSNDLTVGVEAIFTDNVSKSLNTPTGFSTKDELRSQSYEIKSFSEFSILGLTIKPSGLFGIDKYHQKRRDVTTLSTARSKTTGWHFQGDLEVWRDLLVAEILLLRPTIGLEYTFTKTRSFTETGAGFLNLAVGAARDNRIVSRLGLSSALLLTDAAGGTIAQFAGLEWLYNFNTRPTTAQVGLVAIPSQTSKTPLFAGSDRNGARVTAGLLYQPNNTLEFYAAYRGEFFITSTSHTGALSFQVSF